MTDRVEALLREAMADEATRAPTPEDLAGQAHRRVARRRRTMLESWGAVAVAVGVLAAVAVFAVNRPSVSVAPPQDSVSPTPTSVAPPPGTRLVGIGPAAIAVPESWGTNQTRCGTPMKDTVVIDVGAIPACLEPYPDGVESVELWQGKPRFDFAADETLEIDGVVAQRQATTCMVEVGDVEVCSGVLYLPSLKVSFRAESSTGAAQVDRILSRVRVLAGAVGVPGYREVSLDAQENGQQQYLLALQQVGLTAQVQTRKVPGMPPGLLMGTSPPAGTMVPPGSVVTVTVVAEPEGPADEVRVGMNSDTAGEYVDLDDAAVRAGAAIRLGVGDRIWAYADGQRAATLAGELDGNSLEVDGWKEGPNYPHSWVAVAPGRTTVTLTITADGARVVLGTVTVVVT